MSPSGSSGRCRPRRRRGRRRRARPGAGTPPRGWARRSPPRAASRRPLGDQAPAVEEADAVAEQLGLGEVVGGEQHRLAAVALGRGRSRAGSARRARRGRRSARRGSAPPDRASTARAIDRRCRSPVDSASQRRSKNGPSSSARASVVDAGVGGGPLEPVQAREVGEQLAAGEPGVEPGGAGQKPEAAPHLERVVGHVEPRDPRPPGGRDQHPGQDAQGRGLAGAVRTEQAVDLAAADRERQAGDRGGRPEAS